ncbi:acyl-CoA dehydrogenase family protein [Streptomyces coeruleorubidus]|uniref:acyl-CoA dehydrogenase family protein n=1 Tax=Streptomyces coeruleorubidus TaxID=116188 RepID=UPI00378C3B5C
MPEVPPVIRIVLPLIFMEVLLLRYGGPVSARSLDRKSARAWAGEEGLSMDRRSLPREENAGRRAGSCRSWTGAAGRAVVQELIARSRSDFAHASLLVLETAWLIDWGAPRARTEIAAVKVAAPAVATAVIDRAIDGTRCAEGLHVTHHLAAPRTRGELGQSAFEAGSRIATHST